MFFSHHFGFKIRLLVHSKAGLGSYLMVERRTRNRKVAGSSPGRSSQSLSESRAANGGGAIPRNPASKTFSFHRIPLVMYWNPS